MVTSPQPTRPPEVSRRTSVASNTVTDLELDHLYEAPSCSGRGRRYIDRRVRVWGVGVRVGDGVG